MSEGSGKVSSGGTVNGPGLFTYDWAGSKLPFTWFVENDYINFMRFARVSVLLYLAH